MSSVPASSATQPVETVEPDVSAVVTEDGSPVDNFPSEKQQRLLTEPLYSSWSGPPPARRGRRAPELPRRGQRRAVRDAERAEREQARAARLAAQLRAMGIEPDDGDP